MCLKIDNFDLIEYTEIRLLFLMSLLCNFAYSFPIKNVISSYPLRYPPRSSLHSLPLTLQHSQRSIFFLTPAESILRRPTIVWYETFMFVPTGSIRPFVALILFCFDFEGSLKLKGLRGVLVAEWI